MTPRHAWQRLVDATKRQIAAAALRTLCISRAPTWIQTRAARLATVAPALRKVGLGRLAAERVLAIRQDPELRSLLDPDAEISVRRLLDLSVEHPDLDQALRMRLRSADEASISQELYETIVLGQAGPQPRLIFALSFVEAAAPQLIGEHRRAIFARCLSIVRRPADPYDSAAALISGSARQAAAAILAVDSSFDEDVTAALSEPLARANVQALIANALKERPEEAADRFATYLSALAPSEESLIRFAEDCDAERSSLRSTARRRHSLLKRVLALIRCLRPRGSAWYAAAITLPPLAALLLALLSRKATGAIVTAGTEPGVAIGALALLAAVHVLGVQLAAQRLPGPIASATVATPLTLSAYVTGLLTLIASLIGKENPSPDWNPALVASGLLVILIVLAISTTLLSLRGTTIAPAVESVGRRRIRQARRSGARIGRLHRASVEVRGLLDTQPSIRQFTTAQENAHRIRVLAQTTGFMRVDAPRIKEAVASPPWRNGDLRLDLLVISGVRVDTDQEIASIVPSNGSEVHESEIAGVERAFTVRPETALERCCELCVTLCSQLPLLVKAGDPGGAARVLQVLLDLLDAHTASDTRQWAHTEGLLQMSPVIVETVNQALADIRNADADAEREMTGRLLVALIDRAGRDDGLSGLISMKLKGAATLPEFNVLYRSGSRAALTGSHAGLLAAQTTFARLTAGSSETARYANEIAARLVLYCASVAPKLSRAAWSRWWTAAASSPVNDRHLLAARIGAGSLPVGNLSLAVEVAVALRDTNADFDDLIASAHEPEQAAFEQFLSENYGRLLGTDAEQRLVDFLTFAKTVCASIATTAGGTN
ncbi:MAG: hypothetical protein WBV85_13315 [Solirubrobacteraceae bacterium]